MLVHRRFNFARLAFCTQLSVNFKCWVVERDKRDKHTRTTKLLAPGLDKAHTDPFIRALLTDSDPHLRKRRANWSLLQCISSINERQLTRLTGSLQLKRRIL